MTAYYNEIDPYAAQWLRNLIAAGHIAPGEVDERSIEDVRPDDLRGFTQCHFFAGIGVWSYALRLAGWPDDRRVWTGSCPCQPFSAAGKGHGFADERHLWPAWQHLIAQCEPPVIFGEQVASKDAEPWIDLVHADLEGMGYAFGCVPFPAAGVGAPHIRDRNYWVADADDAGRQGRSVLPERAAERLAGAGGVAGGLADAEHDGCDRPFRLEAVSDSNEPNERLSDGDRAARGVADSEFDRSGREAATADHVRAEANRSANWAGGHSGASDAAGPTNGFWRAADWLGCTDGKWRPVEPGTFPLAHGAPSRVGRLRAYGNAINAEAAAEFIRCVM